MIPILFFIPVIDFSCLVLLVSNMYRFSYLPLVHGPYCNIPYVYLWLLQLS
jgi:hypothetical protein